MNASNPRDEHRIGGLHELDREECLRLLSGQEVGRIAFVEGDGPAVVPVNFALDGEDVVVAVAPYSALARAAPGTRVAFEVDQVDPASRSGWSVMVRGAAAATHDYGTARPVPWAPGPRRFLLRVTGEVITGRRLSGG